MVLADSVEPLHYPAIMFSSPSASLPCLPSLPPNPTHSATTLHHSSSSALSLSIPLLTWLSPTPIPHQCCYSSLSIHPPAPSMFFLFSLCIRVSVSLSLHLSDPISLELLLFHRFMPSSLIMFTFICQFPLIYWFYCCDFLKETL